MVGNLISNDIPIHVFRDVTRGGLATVLKELALASGKYFEIDARNIPVDPQVKSFSGLLGLDPLYMGNEGKLVAIVSEACADEAVKIIRASKYGENACIIGRVKSSDEERESGALVLNTEIGGRRYLDILQGEGLPRIC